MIRAEIFDNKCTALGHTASSAIALCRALLAAGHDPKLPLHAYRGPVLALKIRTIGEAARLRPNTGGGFEMDNGYIERTTASPMRASAADVGRSRPTE